MNIEELKLVLETVATVTDDAKTVAIWYFVLTYGASFVIRLSALIGILYSIITIVRYLVSADQWAKIGVKLTHAWGGYGASTYSDPDDPSCLKAVDYCLAAAKEHKK
jgi:uncharacterized membrane protein YciS (DUF1049 family)